MAANDDSRIWLPPGLPVRTNGIIPVGSYTCSTCSIDISDLPANSLFSRDVAPRPFFYGKGGRERRADEGTLEIPITELQRSAEDSNCQKCHVLFGAALPYLQSNDSVVGEKLAMLVQNPMRGSVCIVSREEGASSSTIFHASNYGGLHSERREPREQLYRAQLFVKGTKD